jgi:hypothetical protein
MLFVQNVFIIFLNPAIEVSLSVFFQCFFLFFSYSLYFQKILEGSRLNIGQNSLGYVPKNINEFCIIKYYTKKNIYDVIYFNMTSQVRFQSGSG